MRLNPLFLVVALIPAFLANAAPEKAPVDTTKDLLPEKKVPGWFFHRPSKTNAVEQLKYADGLLAQGKTNAAMGEYNSLAHEWSSSPEAATAQWAYAELLDAATTDYEDTFKEYQYLIRHYTGQFRYDEVLERQYDLAEKLRDTRTMQFLFMPGFHSPERSLPLFEQIVKNAPNWTRTPQAQFEIGLISEQLEKYPEAIRAYEITQNKYGATPVAPKAAFRRAYCLYCLANEQSRDETSCRNALSALTSYSIDYPHDENKARASEYSTELKERLARMYYDRAVYYDRVEKNPAAALAAYQDLIARAPYSADWTRTAEDRISELQSLLEKIHEKK